MKQILAILVIFAMCSHPVYSFAEWVTTDEAETLMQQVEEEIFLCFWYFHVKEEQYGYDGGHKRINAVPNDIFSGNRGLYFPRTIEALKFISTNIHDDGDASKAEDIFKWAAISYQLAYITHEITVPVHYHNLCHGIQVMLISGLMYESITKVDDFYERDLYEDKDTHKAVTMFASLFHDSGHPGDTNSRYQMNDEDVVELMDSFINSVKVIKTGLEAKSVEDKAMDTLIVYFTRGKNLTGGDFNLEHFHLGICISFYTLIFGEAMAGGAQRLAERLIRSTNMKSKNVFHDIIDRFVNTNTNQAKKLQRFGEIGAAGNLFRVDEITHMADICMNATANFNSVVLVVKLVTLEFLEEMELYKEYTEDAYPGYPYCGVRWALFNTSYENVWSQGQTWFNDNIISPTIENETVFTETTLMGYNDVIVADLKKLTDKEVKMDPKPLEKPDAIEKARLIQYLKDFEYFKGTKMSKILKYDDYWILYYLAEHLAINTTLFKDGTFFKAPAESDAVNGFLLFEQDRFDAANPSRRRMRKLLNTII